MRDEDTACKLHGRKHFWFLKALRCVLIPAWMVRVQQHNGRLYSAKTGVILNASVESNTLLNIYLPPNLTQIDNCRFGLQTVGNILSFIVSISWNPLDRRSARNYCKVVLYRRLEPEAVPDRRRF